MSPKKWWPRLRAQRKSVFTSAPLHAAGSEDWSLEPGVLEFIEGFVTRDSVTAETGAGSSTVLIASKGGRHHAVTPSQREVDDIRSLCRERQIDDTRVQFHVGYSQDVLPHLALPPLDLVIVDGGHGIPVPFIDWCYLAPRLKPGGMLVVDDTHLWTGRVLCDFLRAEWQWEMESSFTKAMIFRKKGDPVITDWAGQPFLVANSRLPATWSRIANTMHGHVTGIDAALDHAEQQGPANGDTIEDLLWVEGELLDSVRRIEALIAMKSMDHGTDKSTPT